jgi:hypothetical protein
MGSLLSLLPPDPDPDDDGWNPTPPADLDDDVESMDYAPLVGGEN